MSSSLGARKVKGKSIAPQTKSRRSGLATIANNICVIGNETKIEQNKDMFKEVKTLT